MEWRLLSGLEDEDRRRVLAAATRRRYRRGDILFHEGDPADTLHLLAKRRVLVRVTSPHGDVLTLAVVGAGDAFGEQALLTTEHRRTATVVAAEPTETLVLHADQFGELVRTHPEINQMLVDVLAAEVRRLSAQVLDAMHVPAHKRVLRQVLRFVDVYDDSGTDPVTIPLNQEELASMAGTTRPTANRSLQNAVDSGALALARGRVEVLDRAVLDRLAR